MSGLSSSWISHVCMCCIGPVEGGVRNMTREELLKFVCKVRDDYRRVQRHKSILIKRREAASENQRRGALLSRGNIHVRCSVRGALWVATLCCLTITGAICVRSHFIAADRSCCLFFATGQPPRTAQQASS